MALKLSANLGFLFKERPLQERFRAAKDSGFEAVECAQDIYQHSSDKIAVASRNAAVQVILINSPSGGGPTDRGLAAVPGREEDFKTSISTAITYATALNCSRIHVFAGTVQTPMDWSDPVWQAAKKTFVANIQYAADECNKAGITVCLEAITTIDNYFLQYQNQVAELVKCIDKDNVKLQFDVYHAQCKGGNLCNFFASNIDIIGHVQVSQVPERHEPDHQGEVNFPFFFERLVSLGYSGWVGCEYHPRGTTEEGLSKEWADGYLKR